MRKVIIKKMRKLRYISILIIIMLLTNIIAPVTRAVQLYNDDENVITETEELEEENNIITEETEENLQDDESLQENENEILEENETEEIKEEEETEELEIIEEDEEDISNEEVEENIIEAETVEAEVEVAEEMIETEVAVSGSQTISDGTYRITTALSSSKSLDIAGGSTANGANLQIWSNDEVLQQEFEITYVGDGYYTITSSNSDKVLDVTGAGTANGTNVQQYDYNGTDAQLWVVESAGGGYYYIISKCNGLYLDVSSGSTLDGTNVQVYEGNGTNAQKFAFEEIEEIKGEQTISDGTYRITTALDDSKSLDIAGGSTVNGANLQIWSNDEVLQQEFEIAYIGDGYYKITSVNSDKVLDVESAGRKSGTNVQQYSYNGTDAQLWVIKDAGDGYYYIISKCNGLYLDVSSGSTLDGTNVQVYAGNETNAQKFAFEEILGEQTVENGTYRISTALESSMALDITDGSSDNGANVQIWSSSTVLHQKFELTYVGNGYYKIVSVNSGKVLDVAGAGIANGTNVQQYEYNGTDAQLWSLEDAGDGYYYIISKCNGLYLDVSGGSTTDGTNVQVYEGNGTTAQQFSFDEVYFGIDVSKHNGEIDFDTLVASGQIDFMIARVGWYSSSKGALQVDSQFERNYTLAKENDLALGTYIYSYATSVEEAEEEAYALVEYLEENGYSFELPVFYDIEDSTYQGSLSAEIKTAMCVVFGEILKEAGYKVGIYTSKSWLINEINVEDIPSDYTIWVASWGTNDGYVPEDIYKYAGDHDIWQYTSTGSIPGITGNVDISIAYSLIF